MELHLESVDRAPAIALGNEGGTDLSQLLLLGDATMYVRYFSSFLVVVVDVSLVVSTVTLDSEILENAYWHRDVFNKSIHLR